MRVLRYFVFGVIAAVFVAGALKAEAQMGFSFDNPILNKPAPDFTLPMLNGQGKSLSALSNGKDTILFFWATWCPHCRAQLKELSAQRSVIEEKGIKVLLVDVGEDAGLVQGYLDKNTVNFDVFLDENSEVSEQYNLIGVPTFIFIDKQGVIKGVEHAVPSDYAAAFGEG